MNVKIDPYLRIFYVLVSKKWPSKFVLAVFCCNNIITKYLIKKISVNYYIQLLTEVRKVKINDTWFLNEFINQPKKLVAKLNIKLT